MAEAAIGLRGVDFAYRSGEAVLRGIDLEVAEGELVAVIGPSGCGKSTLLRVAAGLLGPTGGGVEVLGGPPEARRGEYAFIFQDATLLPWLTTEANIALPLRLRGDPKQARRRRARELAELVGVRDRLGYHPHELSGGMRMRVSLARALTLEPRVLFLDEPFASLDAITRNRLGLELLRLREVAPFSGLLVTHAVSEAVFLADRVVVMAAHPGRIIATEAIELPRPRTESTRQGEAYLRCVGRLTAHLEDAA